MDQLRVRCVMDISYNAAFESVSTHMDSLEKQVLNYTSWPAYPYKPHVQFSIAYADDCIFLKYYVLERSIRAAAGKINGAVWEDSCVELFIAFDEGGYYNLEFNCTGTALVGFSKERTGRKLLPEELIQKIKYQSCIRNKDDAVYWELTLAIPFTVFMHHNIATLKGKECKANFYKCGDALPQPHFVSWRKIEAPQPDFHLPQFFGEIVFE